MSRNIFKVKIALGLYQRDSRRVTGFGQDFLDNTCCTTTKRSYNRQCCIVHATDNSLDELGKMCFVVNQGLTIEREYNIFAFLKSKFIKYGRTLQATVIIAKIINENVANHVDLTQLSTLFVGNVVVTDTCREENIAQTINDKTIDFFRHIDVKAACSCCNMC